ncbi:MAG: DUF3043 domain-containing protein, partial [Actinomycetota bacterium]
MSEKKGRPTPKRKEAEKERVLKRLAPAATKEAKKLQKRQSRIARSAQREAYLRGEVSALPPRGRGAIRTFVREYVDGSRSIGDFF